jgi:hypothetical protein
MSQLQGRGKSEAAEAASDMSKIETKEYLLT